MIRGSRRGSLRISRNSRFRGRGPAKRRRTMSRLGACNRPDVGESGKKFAERLMREKYGDAEFKKGPGSEFGRIQKWGDRGFKEP
jgi:hypothetical protein